MVDATKSAGIRRPLDRAAVMVCAVLLVLVAPLALWLLAAFVVPAWPPVRTNRSGPNCASATVHELAIIGNASLDPCDDFSHYACSDRQLLVSHDVRRDEFLKAVVNPTLQGTLRSHASVLLNQLYTSCMKRMANNPVTPESASIASLESLRLWGLGDNGSVNFASILASMDLRYNMKVGMEPFITTLDPVAKRASLLMIARDTRDVHVTGVDNEILRHRSLLALSGALGHNVTAEDVRGLITEVRRQAAGKTGTKRGNYSLVAEIYRTPLMDPMMRKLCDCNEYLAVEVQRPGAIVAQLEVLSRQHLRPTALAYLSLWVSVDLMGGEINATYAGGRGAEHSTAEKMRYCVDDIMRFSHVWDIIAVEKLRTEEKDRALSKQRSQEEHPFAFTAKIEILHGQLERVLSCAGINRQIAEKRTGLAVPLDEEEELEPSKRGWVFSDN
ncbi:uncharacterized protein [Dermacentor andersoni]|uniref:uncharacterized protein n=1 Tax=Dermacentor andersoni TaxID=34620 RepID=UPI003B3A6176